MVTNDTGSAKSMGQSTGTATGLHALNIADIVTGLAQDLQGLRDGSVTIPQARARSQIAHEIFRGINLLIIGQKMIEGAAKSLPSPETKKAGRPRRDKIVDVQAESAA